MCLSVDQQLETHFPPDSTIPAKRIHGLDSSAGNSGRKERLKSSASEMPGRLASSFAARYFLADKLNCVLTMITI